VRTVFDDFVTADIEAGRVPIWCCFIIFTNEPSGLDASVGFESGRPENLGTIEFDGLNFIDRTIIGVTHRWEVLYLQLELTRVF
jgi:hypothetical protein